MTPALTCSAPHCPRPSAPADQWHSLAGLGLPGVAHTKCIHRLYKRRAAGHPLDAPVRGSSRAPVVPCSSPQCADPLGGRCHSGYSRPVRVTIDGRPYCKRCGRRARERVRRGTPVDAPLHGAIDDLDDTGPEPTEAEVDALFALDGWFLAAWRVNCMLAALPPVVLDELSGAAFSGRLVDAFDRRDLVEIYGSIELHGEVR